MENDNLKTEIVIIGSGPGGYVAAIKLAQLGKKVIVVDKEDYLGGICLNHGCIPTKALIHSTNFFDQIDELKLMGIKIKDYDFNFTQMLDWKNKIVKKLNFGIKSLFDHYNIEFIKGTAFFKNSHELEIKKVDDKINNIDEIRSDDGNKKIIFERAIISTGSSPIELNSLKFDNENILNSNEILNLNEIPKKLVIIGGGYIGSELAFIFNRLGSEVIIIDSEEKILSYIDSDLVNVVLKKMNHVGIKIYNLTKVISYEKNEKINLKIFKDNSEQSLVCDKVLVSIGRKPNSNNLGLENTKVKINEKNFIIVNDFLKTDDENIYAIGDVIGNPMLAHKASYEAKIVSENICNNNNNNDNNDISMKNILIPSVVYTDPEIASVGLSEIEAKEKFNIKLVKFNFSNIGRSLTLNKTEGFIKIILNQDDESILGIHLVGNNVSELIAEATLIVQLNLKLNDLKKIIHPHPTMSEIIMEAIDECLDSSVHVIK
jgi:dihydrolipoamide dehydrogenase